MQGYSFEEVILQGKRTKKYRLAVRFEDPQYGPLALFLNSEAGVFGAEIAEALEQAVFESLKKQMDVLGAVSNDGTTMVKAAVSQRPEFERQIEALEDGKLHLYEQFQLREIDLDTYKAQKEALDAQLLKVKNAYAALSAQAKQEQEAKEKQAQRKSITKELTAATGLTSALTDVLIDKVRVYPGSRIEIAYKVQDLFE